MSNVYNRRLFKPRPARAKLNQMGGIMASSVPLMQSVQKFSTGNQVRIGGSNPLVRSPVRTSYVPGQGYTQFSPLTNPAVQATVARNVQRQRAANVGIPDMPATGLTAGRPPPTPITSRGLLNRLLDETVEAEGPLVTGLQTLFGGDPVARANLVRSGLGLETVGPKSPEPKTGPQIRPGIQTDNPEEDLITEDVPPTFGQRTGAETDDAGFVGADTELFTMDDSPSANVTLSDLGKDDEDVITGKTPLGYLGRDDGDDDKQTSRQIADVTKGRDDDDGDVTTDTRTDTDSSANKTISEQANPAAQVSKMDVEEAVDPKSPKKAKDVVNPITQRVLNALANQDVDGAEDIAAAAIGADEVSEIGSTNTKERIQKQRAIISEFLGVDPDEYKKDRSLALASAFFKYAQTGDIGESGNTLVSNLQKIKANKRARQDKIDSLALTTVLNREEKEADREFRAKQSKLTRDHDWRKVAKQESGKLQRLSAEIDTRLYLADTANALKIDLKNKDIDIVNAQIQARADNLATQIASSESEGRITRESALLRAQYSGLGDATKLAMVEGQALGLEGKKLTDHIDKRSGDILRTDVITGPDSLRRLVVDISTAMIKEGESANFGEASTSILNSIRNNPELRSIYEKDLRALGLLDESSTTTTTTGTGTGSTDNQSTPFTALSTSG